MSQYRALLDRLRGIEDVADGVIAGEVVFQTPIRVARFPEGGSCFFRSYIMVDHLARRLKKEEYTFRLVVYDDDIKKLELEEGGYYFISGFTKIKNTEMNLRDGQSPSEYVLLSSTLIQPM